MNDSKDMGVFMLDADDRVWGIASYERLEKAKWWQKAMAKMSPKYKNRFKDLKPIEVEYTGGGVYDMSMEERPPGTEIEITTK